MKSKQAPGMQYGNAVPTDPSVYCFEYTPESDQSIAVSIVRAISHVKDTDPESLHPRLYDVVDPDALEQLLTHHGCPETPLEVTFEIADLTITIDRSRHFSITVHT
ncbi:MAG: HalOD1 output domain-containing protein [Halobacteriota archaeon]